MIHFSTALHNVSSYNSMTWLLNSTDGADQVANVGIVDVIEDHRSLWDIKRRGVGYKKLCPLGSREVRNKDLSYPV